MSVILHPHALERMAERGATPEDVEAAIRDGATTPANFGRTQFRLLRPGSIIWRGRTYAAREIDVFAVRRNGDWLVITVIVRYISSG